MLHPNYLEICSPLFIILPRFFETHCQLFFPKMLHYNINCINGRWNDSRKMYSFCCHATKTNNCYACPCLLSCMCLCTHCISTAFIAKTDGSGASVFVFLCSWWRKPVSSFEWSFHKIALLLRRAVRMPVVRTPEALLATESLMWNSLRLL